MRNTATLPGWPAVLRAPLAAAYLGLSRAAFDAAVKRAALPKPIPIVGSVKGWDRAELDAWLDARRNPGAALTGNEWDEAPPP